jgi:hypothetical protein
MFNGLAIEGDRLYATDYFGREVIEFYMEEDKSLTRVDSVEVAGNPDNPSASNGVVFVGMSTSLH